MLVISEYYRVQHIIDSFNSTNISGAFTRRCEIQKKSKYSVLMVMIF